jgi:hypothetical protein
MTRYILPAIGGIALAASIWAAPVSAAGPIGALKDAAAADSLVHKVWGCHRSCELGPGGWHRHVGPYCVRVACWPQAKRPFRCWVGRWGKRHCWY